MRSIVYVVANLGPDHYDSAARRVLEGRPADTWRLPQYQFASCEEVLEDEVRVIEGLKGFVSRRRRYILACEPTGVFAARPCKGGGYSEKLTCLEVLGPYLVTHKGWERVEDA